MFNKLKTLFKSNPKELLSTFENQRLTASEMFNLFPCPSKISFQINEINNETAQNPVYTVHSAELLTFIMQHSFDKSIVSSQFKSWLSQADLQNKEPFMLPQNLSKKFILWSLLERFLEEGKTITAYCPTCKNNNSNDGLKLTREMFRGYASFQIYCKCGNQLADVNTMHLLIPKSKRTMDKTVNIIKDYGLNREH